MGYTIYSSIDCGWTWQATNKTGMSEAEAEDTAHQMTMNLDHLRTLFCARRPEDITDTSGLIASNDNLPTGRL